MDVVANVVEKAEGARSFTIIGPSLALGASGASGARECLAMAQGGGSTMHYTGQHPTNERPALVCQDGPVR